MADDGADDGGQSRTVMVTIGGRQYPTVVSSHCAVCKSVWRTQIEEQIVGGHPYLSIYTAMENNDPRPPDVASIRGHVAKGHMALPYARKREVIEQSAQRSGRDVETHSGSLVDYATVTDLVVQLGFEGIVAGTIQPGMSDILKAVQIQAQIAERTSPESTEAEWRKAFMEFAAAVRRIVPDELWQRVGHELQQSPRFRELTAVSDQKLERKAHDVVQR